MRWIVYAAMILTAFGQLVDPVVMLSSKTQPAKIEPTELSEFDTLTDTRQHLIEESLALARDWPWLPYLNGGAKPEAGGFDCSGAMYFVMRAAGLDPPRSSGAQMAWLKKSGRLHVVSPDAKDLKHVSLARLLPGDLLFWAVDDNGMARIHHVALYLGTEKIDGRAVMINSTDGRSYRGQKGNGYGVYDFRVPKPESPSKLVGFGPPPGIGID